MESIQVIISLIGITIGFIATTATFLLKFLKNEKAKKLSQSLLTITDVIIPYIEQAEDLITLSGEEKKQYVINMVKTFAKSNNLNLDNYFVDSKIEELIVLTKQVNNKNLKEIEK